MPTTSDKARARPIDVGVLAPAPGTFTYLLPPSLAARALPGTRLLVPFGRRQLTGILLGEAVAAQVASGSGLALREAIDVLDDDLPALPPKLLGLLRWVSDYYLHPLGLTLKSALPAPLVAASHRTVSVTPEGRRALGEGKVVPEESAAALAYLAKRGRALERTLFTRFPRALLDALRARGWAVREEHLDRRGAPTTLLWRANLQGKTLEEGLAEISPRARSQRAALNYLVSRGPIAGGEIPERAGWSVSALRALGERGLALQERSALRVDPFLGVPVPSDTPHALTEAQRVAVDAVNEHVGAGTFRPFLLYGATGSGKTEVYLRVIARALDQGKGAVVLVPEIALTPQLVHRFRARFGNCVAVQHSGLTDRERADQWRRIRNGELPIVIGARSAIFAPLERLGVLIVDEEHEGSYKQEENLLYHARDVAVMRAKMESAVVVLGSATPSLESFHNAAQGRYTRLDLPERVTARALPEVDLVDMRKEPPAAGGEAPILSGALRSALRATVERGEQAILFLNRRGFATFLFCRDCGHAFRCSNCDVSLVLHRGPSREEGALRCHSCDYKAPVPAECPECGGGQTESRGQGTQRVEAEVRAAVPEAQTVRLDRDVSMRRGAREEILASLRAGKADVLIGTQMVAKGHDFPRVTLVGVISAESSLYFPDFRAPERTFQLLTQVAGRAGRGEAAGRVLVQTYDPDNACLFHVRSHDYDGFYQGEIGHRREPRWPPFCRLTNIRVTAPVQAVAEEGAALCAEAARRLCASDAACGRDVEVLGPSPAIIPRVRNRWRWQVLLKGNRQAMLRRVALAACAALPGRGVRASVVVDVDPVSML